MNPSAPYLHSSEPWPRNPQMFLLPPTIISYLRGDTELLTPHRCHLERTGTVHHLPLSFYTPEDCFFTRLGDGIYANQKVGLVKWINPTKSVHIGYVDDVPRDLNTWLWMIFTWYFCLFMS